MLTPDDLIAGEVAFGQRPALVVVDMSYGFTSADSPLGGDFNPQVEAMVELVSLFRQYQWPIAFSTVVYKDDNQASVFRQHLPALNILRSGSRWVEIDKRLKPTDADILVEKTIPSAFFGTYLDTQLRARSADCMVVGGLTTSGCVRATVVDALQYNWPTWVIPEICGDRNLAAHQANLHDMAAKYAQVIGLKAAKSEFRQIFEQTNSGKS